MRFTLSIVVALAATPVAAQSLQSLEQPNLTRVPDPYFGGPVWCSTLPPQPLPANPTYYYPRRIPCGRASGLGDALSSTSGLVTHHRRARRAS